MFLSIAEKQLKTIIQFSDEVIPNLPVYSQHVSEEIASSSTKRSSGGRVFFNQSTGRKSAKGRSFSKNMKVPVLQRKASPNIKLSDFGIPFIVGSVSSLAYVLNSNSQTYGDSRTTSRPAPLCAKDNLSVSLHDMSDNQKTKILEKIKTYKNKEGASESNHFEEFWKPEIHQYIKEIYNAAESNGNPAEGSGFPKSNISAFNKPVSGNRSGNTISANHFYHGNDQYSLVALYSGDSPKGYSYGRFASGAANAFFPHLMTYFMNCGLAVEDAIKKSMSWMEMAYKTVVPESPKFEAMFKGFQDSMKQSPEREITHATLRIMICLLNLDPVNELRPILVAKGYLIDLLRELYEFEVWENPDDSARDRIWRTLKRADDFYKVLKSEDDDVEDKSTAFATALIMMLKEKKEKSKVSVETAIEYALKACEEKDVAGSFWNKEYLDFQNNPGLSDPDRPTVQILGDQNCQLVDNFTKEQENKGSEGTSRIPCDIGKGRTSAVVAVWKGDLNCLNKTQDIWFGQCGDSIALLEKTHKEGSKVEFTKVFAEENYHGCCGGNCQTVKNAKDFDRFVLVSRGVDVQKMIEMRKKKQTSSSLTKTRHQFAEDAKALVGMFTPSPLKHDISALVVTSNTIQNPSAEQSTSKCQEETEETEMADEDHSDSAATAADTFSRQLRKTAFQKLKVPPTPTKVTFANRTATPEFSQNSQPVPTEWKIVLQVHEEEGLENYSLTLKLTELANFEFMFLENGRRMDTAEEAEVINPLLDYISKYIKTKKNKGDWKKAIQVYKK